MVGARTTVTEKVELARSLIMRDGCTILLRRMTLNAHTMESVGDAGLTSLERLIAPYLKTEKRTALLILAPHDFEPSALRWDGLRAAHPGLRIVLAALEEHRAMTCDSSGFDAYIALSVAARRSAQALAGEVARFLQDGRRSRPALAVGWFPAERFIVLQVVFELLVLLTGASRCLLVDEVNELMIELSWPRFLVQRAPKAVGELLLTPLLLVGLLALAKVGQRFPKKRLPWTAGRRAGKPVRVLYLQTDLVLARGNAPFGGAAAHMRGVIEAFRRMGSEVRVIATGPLPGMDGVDPPVEIVSPPRLTALPWELMELIQNVPILLRGLRRARSFKPGLIYHRHGMGAFSAVALGRLLKLPTVLETNAVEVRWRQQHGRVLFPAVGLAIERMAFQQADVLVTVSERVKDAVLAEGADPEKVIVLPNAADPERFRPDVDGRRVRERYALSGVVVGFVGGFYPWHGIDMLAAAVQRVLDLRPETQFLFVGTGKHRRHIEELKASAQYGPAITLAGPVEYTQVPEHMAAMDILTAPHAAGPGFLGSPVKLFEYLGMGRAIVASDLEQMGQIIKHERNGLLVPPGDAEALAAAIVRLVDDVALRERLGRQARADMLERHTWDSNLQRLLAFLGERGGAK